MIDIEICPICGQEVDNGGDEAIDATENMNFCDECQRYVCTTCYCALDFMCEECLEKQENEAAQ